MFRVYYIRRVYCIYIVYICSCSIINNSVFKIVVNISFICCLVPVSINSFAVNTYLCVCVCHYMILGTFVGDVSYSLKTELCFLHFFPFRLNADNFDNLCFYIFGKC